VRRSGSRHPLRPAAERPRGRSAAGAGRPAPRGDPEV
jgi:hypothetical protein